MPSTRRKGESQLTSRAMTTMITHKTCIPGPLVSARWGSSSSHGAEDQQRAEATRHAIQRQAAECLVIKPVTVDVRAESLDGGRDESDIGLSIESRSCS